LGENPKKERWKPGWVAVIVALLLGYVIGNQGAGITETPSNPTEENSTVAEDSIQEGPVETQAPEEEVPLEVVDEFAWPENPGLERSGSGDEVWLFPELLIEPIALEIEGNESGRFFAVRPIFESGETGSSLVSATDPYSGMVLFWEDEPVAGLEIEIIDEWNIQSQSLNSLELIDTSSPFEDSGDSLISLNQESGIQTLDVVGNSAGRFFAVRAYGAAGRIDSIISATDPYEGTVLVPAGTLFLEIESIGDWSIATK